MLLQNPFDARTVEPSSFPLPLPLADYKCVIVATEGKPTGEDKEHPSGGALVLTLRVIEGQFMNREQPDWLNIFNQNQDTVRIAYQKLSAYCHVTGVFNLQDSQQLCNIPFIATIGPQKDNPQFGKVYGVKDINGNAPGKPGNGTPVAASAPSATAPPAWGQPPAQPAAHAYAPPAAAPPNGWGPPAAAPAPAPAAPPAQAAMPWQPAPPAAPGQPPVKMPWQQ